MKQYVYNGTSYVLNEDVVGLSELPTPSAKYLDKAYLLTAVQTGYEKGIIYECKNTGTTESPVYSWVAITNSGEGSNDNVYNVLDYGLDGTGVTDGTSSLQTMLETIPNGSIVYFPKGKYKFSDTITIKKNVSFRGESVGKPIIFTNSIAASRPESMIAFVPSTTGKTLFVAPSKDTSADPPVNSICHAYFENLSFYAQIEDLSSSPKTYTPIYSKGNNKGTTFTSYPHPVWNHTDLLANTSCIDVAGTNLNNGDSHIKNCLFSGFSGFAVRIPNHRYVEGCSFQSCKVGVKVEGTDSLITDCWFCNGDTAIEMSHSLYPDYCNVEVNDCWCDQMSSHFIHGTGTSASFMILAADNWVDMIDKAAICVEGGLHDSRITGRYSRCGMSYAGLELADRTWTDLTEKWDLISQADVIVARTFIGCNINIGVQKRRINKPDVTDYSDAYCPSKVISCYGESSQLNSFKDTIVIVPEEFKTQRTVTPGETPITEEDTIFDDASFFKTRNATFYCNGKWYYRHGVTNTHDDRTFSGTLDEWEALTPEEQAKYDFVASPEENGYTDSYSTTETKTNKVWIDGKPIYRRVFVPTSYSFTNGYVTISSGSWVTEIEVIIRGIIICGAVTVTAGRYYKNGNNLQFNLGYEFNGGPTNNYVILEYTKTTDD